MSSKKENLSGRIACSSQVYFHGQRPCNQKKKLSVDFGDFMEFKHLLPMQPDLVPSEADKKSYYVTLLLTWPVLI